MNGQVLQLLISVGGIAIMVALCWALFGRATAKLPDVDALGARMACDIPGFRTGAVTLSDDRLAALVEDVHGGAVYLAIAHGDGIVTRKISRELDIERAGDRIVLRMKDFTLKALKLSLPDAERWETKLKERAA